MQQDIIKEKVQSALAEIRPMLAQHLGDIELVRIENNVIYVKMLGMCDGCPLSTLTLKAGVEELLKMRVPGIAGVEAVYPV
ncbi:MAG: NifU family protein [Candidatus Sungbacteria bacterium]|nr:NifU family protein [Candidatus Sungbacteria bacterium]